MKSLLVYLTGQDACDVARLTGLPIYCRPRLASHYPEEPVSPEAAESAIRRGVWKADDVMMDLTRLDWWDKWRVALAMIGAHAYMDGQEHMLAA